MKYLITHSLSKDEKTDFEKQGLYCYDLRDSDEGNGIASIEKRVIVNNVGSIITNEEIKLGTKYEESFVDFEKFINSNQSVDIIEELKLQEEPFKFYDNNEIIKLLKSKEKLVYVDDGCDELIIRYKDIPDFIVDVNERIGNVDLKIFDYDNPTMTPILTTIGCFLNKCDVNVRKNIIDRLVELQTGKEKVKEYKVMDEYTVANAKESMKKIKKEKSQER